MLFHPKLVGSGSFSQVCHSDLSKISLSPLSSPACPLHSTSTSSWLCLLSRAHIHPAAPHPMTQSLPHISASLTWSLASAPPLPFVLYTSDLPKMQVFPCLISGGLPMVSGSSYPTLLSMSFQSQFPKCKSWLCRVAKQFLPLGMPLLPVFACEDIFTVHTSVHPSEVELVIPVSLSPKLDFQVLGN